MRKSEQRSLRFIYGLLSILFWRHPERSVLQRSEGSCEERTISDGRRTPDPSSRLRKRADFGMTPLEIQHGPTSL